MTLAYHQEIAPSHRGDGALSHATQVLRKLYGYSALRSHQKAVLHPFLQGRDTLAVIPTGGGKSMCYVLPAMMGPGLGVVISPLISLIRDQVIKLRKLGVPAASFDSMQTPCQKQEVIQGLERSLIKMLYISPERLAIPGFRDFLAGKDLRFLAVDEAHCISEWGSYFRPEYRKLGLYFDDLPPNIPRLALTATATLRVRQDIAQYLGLRKYAEVVRTPLRENLVIQSKQLKAHVDVAQEVLNYLPSSSDQGIIYTFSRKNTDRLARFLQAKGISSSSYHAGLTAQQRDRTLHRFLESDVHVVVATNAFGLGIDKKDIRFVHHYGLPASLESYMQQIGRAGRDGQESHCCLLYQKNDAQLHRFLWNKNYPSPEKLVLFYKILSSLTGDSGDCGKEVDYSRFYHAVSRMMGDHLDETIQKCLEIFEKEGFVKQIRLKSEEACPHGLRVLKGLEALESFAEHFGDRKQEEAKKLYAMEIYAASGHKEKRDQIVSQYFSGTL